MPSKEEQADIDKVIDKADEYRDAAIGSAEPRTVAKYESMLEQLAAVAQTFGTARDLATIYRALYDFTVACTGCAGIAISLIEQGYRKAVYVCCSGVDLDVSGIPLIKINEAHLSPHSLALLKNEVTIINDMQEALAKNNVFHAGADIDPDVPRSSLIAPMSVMGRSIGSFEIQSYRPAAFNRDHETVMRMVGSLAGVAIENVRMMEREREREEQLRQSQKMEAIGRLAGGVAHDFNNLLTAILGYSQLVQARLASDDPLRNDLAEIEKAGQRAASLTNQLLAFSRKQVLQPKVLDLNQIVAEMEKMLGRLIGEDIELVTFLDPTLGRVKADPGQMTQVIMNLAVNARDAMPRGGKLIIQTANVSPGQSHNTPDVENDEQSAMVMLAISDTGIGMDKETLSHIFEPFFTTKELGKGTGLGLSTVYGIVRQSGGDISVESEPSKGTSFKIYFREVEDEEAKQKQAKENARAYSVSETILLVEDEEIVRRLVTEVLESVGYNVLVAADPCEAISICEKHEGNIQLLLTDVVMPQMSGRDVAERARSLRPDIKVLYMSGYTDDAILRHGVEGAGTAFIQKPFTPDLLTSKVREVIEVSFRPELSGQFHGGDHARPYTPVSSPLEPEIHMTPVKESKDLTN